MTDAPATLRFKAVSVSHVPVLRSASLVRAKICGQTLDCVAMQAIMRETVNGRLSDLHLSAFVTACAGERLSIDETVALTQAMVDAGECLEWPYDIVVDKHCVGGLPGNRTTPVVVAIVSACGLVMPKPCRAYRHLQLRAACQQCHRRDAGRGYRAAGAAGGAGLSACPWPARALACRA